MPAVNGVGKPCAGEPHARFDGRELETAHRSHQGHGDEGHQGKPCGHQRLRDLPSMRVTAPALDPPTTPRMSPPKPLRHGISGLPDRVCRRTASTDIEMYRSASTSAPCGTDRFGPTSTPCPAQGRRHVALPSAYAGST